MTRYARAISVVAILFACATMLAAQDTQPDPFTGTWKLNLAKSKFNPGPAPKSSTVTIAPDGKVTVEETSSEGQSRTWSFTPSGDTAVPIQGLENSTVVEKRTGKVAEFSWNFDGVKSKGRSVLSKNGKMVTYTGDGTDKDGHPIHNVQVYDRAS